MANSLIASFAILKVNWEQPERHDYLDNFVLVVAEAIRQLPYDTVTLSDVQTQIQKASGFLLPQNTIKTLLGRVSKYGYIELKSGTYTRNNHALEKLEFHAIQQNVLRAHEALINELADFASSKYSLSWSPEDTETALLKYLQQNQVELLSDIIVRDPNRVTNQPDVNQKDLYVVGKYVQYLQETQSLRLEYLETVIKGNLLANAIFLTDPSTYQRKFKNTVVIFDAPLVIYALGYTGEPRKRPVIELIDLLRRHGAQLQIFRHSLEEVIGILTACAELIRRRAFRDSYGPSIEYFIEKGYSETDVMMFIENLEANLANLGMTVSDKPSYSEHEHVIGEEDFLDYLQETIGYTKDIARERDKDSISAIYRLRKGETFIAIEECKAVFVTANRSLANCTRRYEEFGYRIGTAPLGITDYELTNIVWLKDPAVAPNTPRKRLIADSFAATQPSEHLWSMYLATIDKLEQDKKITSDQYFLLRHSIQAKSELMEQTLGDEHAFTEGTVAEVLDIVEERLKADQVSRANAEALAKEDALLKLELEREARVNLEEKIRFEKEERQVKIRKRASRVARGVSFFIAALLAVVLAYLTYATSTIGPLNIDTRSDPVGFLKKVGLVVFWLLLIIQILDLVFDFRPKMLLNRLEPIIARWIEKWLTTE
jgi:hypothetical protein